jgi:hypothetical protein
MTLAWYQRLLMFSTGLSKHDSTVRLKAVIVHGSTLELLEKLKVFLFIRFDFILDVVSPLLAFILMCDFLAYQP